MIPQLDGFLVLDGGPEHMKIERLRTCVRIVTVAAATLATVVSADTRFNGDGFSDIAFHRPGDLIWNTVPVLFAAGSGGWTNANNAAPSWANQPGVRGILGDFDGDGDTDVAFHRPGGPWNSVPLLFSNGAGGWSQVNAGAPSWANQPGVVGIAGDFNGDGRTDIAFHRPGGSWSTVPVLFAKGSAGWNSSNRPAPSWANQPGVVAIAGDLNGDGRTDIAFHRPGGPWSTVPVLLAKGDGAWDSANTAAPSWANQPGVKAIPGDFDGNGRGDIAFHRPGGPWSTVPVLFSNGNGSWTSKNSGAPSWANQPGVEAVAGDYDGNGRTDIAFYRPGGPWSTVPVLLSNGNGSWTSKNSAAPSWANQPDVVAIPGRYNADARSDIAFHRPGGPWNTVPVLFANGDGSWSSANLPAPSWANQPHAIAIGSHVRACKPPAMESLAVTLRPQETSMWCWAASGQMTMEYLGHNVAQCVQANNRLNRTDCCNNPVPSACIQGGWPEYEKYGFTATRTSSKALTWQQAQRELSGVQACADRPFAFTWKWPGGGGHVMVAIGYRTIAGVDYVEINDPWAPNVGDHRFITYDYYVESSGHHSHWDDFYEITYTGGS
jgi:hypothetical protein